MLLIGGVAACICCGHCVWLLLPLFPLNVVAAFLAAVLAEHMCSQRHAASRPLMQLHLSDNEITESGVEVLVKATATHTTLYV